MGNPLNSGQCSEESQPSPSVCQCHQQISCDAPDDLGFPLGDEVHVSEDVAQVVQIPALSMSVPADGVVLDAEMSESFSQVEGRRAKGGWAIPVQGPATATAPERCVEDLGAPLRGTAPKEEMTAHLHDMKLSTKSVLSEQQELINGFIATQQASAASATTSLQERGSERQAVAETFAIAEQLLQQGGSVLNLPGQNN
eukprot:1156736-Amphidinium_carterae.1